MDNNTTNMDKQNSLIPQDLMAFLDSTDPDATLPEPMTIYGIGGTLHLKTHRPIMGYTDEGDTILIRLQLADKQYNVRVVKENPKCGIMISGHTEDTTNSKRTREVNNDD